MIPSVQKKLIRLFSGARAVGIVYLFGSRARGGADRRSDYDFAFYFLEKNLVRRHRLLFRLAADLSRILETDAIDVVSLNDVSSTELKYNIIHEGRVLFEREPHRVLIEPRILNEYFDFKILRGRYGEAA